MAIIPTEGRNIVNYARKIVAEKLIFERRQWETMRDNKHHADVKEMGESYLTSYKGLMISITSLDLLNTSIAGIDVNVVKMVDFQARLVDRLASYLLLELTREELDALAEQLAHAIFYWSFGKNGNFDTYTEGEKSEEVTATELQASIADTLAVNVPYIVVILLSDLHHMSYVASAEQCLEILSST